MDSLLLRLLEDDSSSDEDYDVAAIMLADLAKNEQPKHGGSVQGHEVVRRNKQKKEMQSSLMTTLQKNLCLVRSHSDGGLECQRSCSCALQVL